MDYELLIACSPFFVYMALMRQHRVRASKWMDSDCNTKNGYTALAVSILLL